MRRIALFTLALFLILGGAAAFLFRQYTSCFPEIQPGVYAGTLEGSKGVAPTPWLVVRVPGEQSLAVAIGDVRLPAQKVAPLDPSGRTRLPLVVGENEARLRMVGSERQPGHYEGTYTNPISHEQGRWRLSLLHDVPGALVVEQDLTRWFSLWQELEAIEHEIQESQRKADEQRVSIENLHRYVSDGETLRKTADVRLGRSDSELEAARSELQQRQQQLDKALRDFDLSQRISREGKLVFLSRETIQRESRWIELTLQLLAPETSLGFDRALERAERIQTLKKTIAKEREGVVERSTQDRYQGKERETRDEEEFYGHLQ